MGMYQTGAAIVEDIGRAAVGLDGGESNLRRFEEHEGSATRPEIQMLCHPR